MQMLATATAILLSIFLLSGSVYIGQIYSLVPSFPYPKTQQAEQSIQLVTYESLHPEIKKQIDCLADNIYFEAGAEPNQGKFAVAFVTMNRVYSNLFPKTICGVVKQKNSRVCQFSWWCDPDIRSRMHTRKFTINDDRYKVIRQIAINVYMNYENLNDITKGALFFHTKDLPLTTFGPGVKKTVQIGQHIFYRKKNGQNTTSIATKE